MPVDLWRYSKDEREIIAIVERSKGQPLTQEEINLSLRQAFAIGELEVEPKIVPVTTVDLSHYSKEEREIIEYLQKDEGRPLTQEEINLDLAQAWAIGHLEVEPEIVPVTLTEKLAANPRFKPAKSETAVVIVGARPAVQDDESS
jgi:hypothetical protein